jgi:hypothetical protein
VTGPDPRRDDATQTHNQVRSDRLETAFQSGQVHGDAHVGNTIIDSRTTVSLSAVGVVVGAVLALVMGLVVWKVVATENPPAATSTIPPDGSTARTSPKTSARPDSTPAREVRLTSRTGVDLDGDDAQVNRVDGASGDTDLYLNESGILHTNGNGFADDHGTEQQAKARCTDAVARGDNTNAQALPVMGGTQYCFATSDGKVGWLRVKTSKLVAPVSLTIAVVVWQP